MKYKIAWMKGDGIGEEISNAAIKGIDVIEENTTLKFDIDYLDLGDSCKKARGEALPSDTLNGILNADAAIKGPVGETAAETIIQLRQSLDLYANLRPVKNYPGVASIKNFDILIVRENTEDLYKGWEFPIEGAVLSIRLISAYATRRLTKVAINYAKNRKNKITIVHKANVLKQSDDLFRRIAREEISKVDEIDVNEMYVDAMSMDLIRNPSDYDIILTTNMYGDILSDEAAQVAGGLGFAPSGNLGDKIALFEPAHGSAPDIAGRNIANPYSMILSMGMMFYWLGNKHNDKDLLKLSHAIESSVSEMTTKGILTTDAGGSYSTDEVGENFKSILVKLIVQN